jgi:hypothetical protein
MKLDPCKFVKIWEKKDIIIATFNVKMIKVSANEKNQQKSHYACTN